MIPFLLSSSHCLKITQNVAFEILILRHFPTIFVLLKVTYLVTLFDRKFQLVKNSPKLDHFWAFSTNFCLVKNVYVARFARNVE